jgi:hypothetical protein
MKKVPNRHYSQNITFLTMSDEAESLRPVWFPRKNQRGQDCIFAGSFVNLAEGTRRGQ